MPNIGPSTLLAQSCRMPEIGVVALKVGGITSKFELCFYDLTITCHISVQVTVYGPYRQSILTMSKKEQTEILPMDEQE